MLVLMVAFTLFHFATSTASLALAVRLLTAEERVRWQSKRGLALAQVICWVYPLVAFVAGHLAWQVFRAAAPHALPLILAPILWLIVMGAIFAIVDFAEDGVLGNARRGG